MDAARTEADETTRLLTHPTNAVRGSDDGSSPVRRQRLLQKQILLLALVLALLQSHLILFNSASRVGKLQQICYKYNKEHHPDMNRKMGEWIHCYIQEEVLQLLREFVHWEKVISPLVCESMQILLRSNK